MAKNVAPKKGRKNRKHGRNKTWCEAYRRSGRQEKNAAKRQARHLKRYGQKKDREV